MATPALMTADTYNYFSSVFSPVWGIFKNGVPVVIADSVAGFEFRSDWLVSDFPLETGAFESYDKVFVPYAARFRFAAGGSVANRSALLHSIAAIAGNLELYDAASPEKIYLSCNIVHYDYRRTSVNGVGLIIVDVWLSEVRVVQSASSPTLMPSGMLTGAVANPISASQINGGHVQAVSTWAPLPLFA